MTEFVSRCPLCLGWCFFMWRGERKEEVSRTTFESHSHRSHSHRANCAISRETKGQAQSSTRVRRNTSATRTSYTLGFVHIMISPIHTRSCAHISANAHCQSKRSSPEVDPSTAHTILSFSCSLIFADHLLCFCIISPTNTFFKSHVESFNHCNEKQ